MRANNHASNGVQPVDTSAEQDWSGWERWLAAHLEIEREGIAAATGDAIGNIFGPLRARVNALEKTLAELTGAMSVLRGLGPPPGLKICGTYNSATSYERHDVVARNGSSFVAIKDNPGECPGPNWQLLASKGSRGDRGVQGLPGVPGQQGESGKVASLISEWQVDLKAYTITPVLTDGRTGPPLQLRDLFQQFLNDVRSK